MAEEEAISCLLAAEWAKFEKAIEFGDTLDDFIALDSAVASFIDKICCL